MVQEQVQSEKKGKRKDHHDSMNVFINTYEKKQWKWPPHSPCWKKKCNCPLVFGHLFQLCLLNVVRIHPGSQVRNKLGREKRQGWRQGTAYIESGHPGHKLLTVHNKGSVQVTERQAWRPALLWHLWARDWWPQAGLKWGAGPWALYGPREASQDYWGLVVPSEPWEKKEKRTCWDQSIWSAIRY